MSLGSMVNPKRPSEIRGSIFSWHRRPRPGRRGPLFLRAYIPGGGGGLGDTVFGELDSVNCSRVNWVQFAVRSLHEVKLGRGGRRAQFGWPDQVKPARVTHRAIST